MVFNTTFNNISAIWWQSVLLVEETGLPEKITDFPQFTDKLLSNNVVLSTPRLNGIQTLVVIGTDHCIGSYKSNYHTIKTTTSLD